MKNRFDQHDCELC